MRELRHVTNIKAEKERRRYKSQVAVSQSIFLLNPSSLRRGEIDRISYAERDRSLMNHPQYRVSECEQKNEHRPQAITMTYAEKQ